MKEETFGQSIGIYVLVIGIILIVTFGSMYILFSDDKIGSKEEAYQGETVCLPHIGYSGPETLECTLGIKTDNGLNYALDTTDVSSEFDTTTGETVNVKGTLISYDNISSGSKLRSYDIEGVIVASSVETLSQ